MAKITGDFWWTNRTKKKQCDLAFAHSQHPPEDQDQKRSSKQFTLCLWCDRAAQVLN